MSNRNILISILIALALVTNAAFATGSLSITGVTVPTSVSQGSTFTIIVSIASSGTTGTISGSLTLPSGISCTPSGSQTISGTSASWSCSASVAGDYSNQITVSVSDQGGLSDSEQTGLIVLSPAALTASSVIASSSISAGSSTTLTIGVNNAGDSSTNFTITMNCPSGVSCSPSSVSSTSISGKSIVNTPITVTGTSAGTYTITATINGGNGQTLTTSKTLTVTSAGGGGEGGAGGGGGGLGGGVSGGAVGTTNVSEEIKTIASISAGGKTTVTITNAATFGIKTISIAVKNAVNNVQITVSKTTHPSGAADVVESAKGKVYKYIEIKKANIKDEDISAVTISVQVEKTWISSNNIDEDKVKLYRYDASSKTWTELSTVKTGSDANNVYYDATSPGLSIFAIAGMLKEGAAPPEEEKPTEKPTEQPTAPAADYTWLVILVILIIVAALGYYLYVKGFFATKKRKI